MREGKIKIMKNSGTFILILIGAVVVLIYLAIKVLLPVIAVILLIALVILFFIGLYQLYKIIYFHSKSFSNLKKEIEDYVSECNDLNNHIEELKKSYIAAKRIDYGSATYTDDSIYNFRRPNLENISYGPEIYDCSLSVCRNAHQQPFKYVCKYFNITVEESTLENFEKIFNNFSAAEQGKNLLKAKKDEIMDDISYRIPFLIRIFSKKTLSSKLGFEEIDFNNLYFPRFIFRYISAGGNSTMKCDVILDLEKLERFIGYLSDSIKFKKSIAGQRALMTSRLREEIKARDNYTCQNCGLSTRDEPHLLLEIDHIIPLAKNGLTTKDNLQTLCWKCNRSKGAK